MTAIAEEAFNEHKIKAPTISAMARASLMTMANWKLRIDQANTEIKQADQKRLQAIAGPSKIPYSNLQNIPGIIANVPSYQQFALSMKQYLNEVLREVASFKKTG
ncbi:MAG: hypothetical protein WBZ36_14655 [Candidatus Nitrosopolaris sp.]